jgi:hypothetical protein
MIVPHRPRRTKYADQDNLVPFTVENKQAREFLNTLMPPPDPNPAPGGSRGGDNQSPFRGPTEVEALLRDVMQTLVCVQSHML